MSADSIILMAVSIITVWGGLAASTRFLITHPIPENEMLDAPEG